MLIKWRRDPCGRSSTRQLVRCSASALAAAGAHVVTARSSHCCFCRARSVMPHLCNATSVAALTQPSICRHPTGGRSSTTLDAHTLATVAVAAVAAVAAVVLLTQTTSSQRHAMTISEA